MGDPGQSLDRDRRVPGLAGAGRYRDRLPAGGRTRWAAARVPHRDRGDDAADLAARAVRLGGAWTAGSMSSGPGTPPSGQRRRTSVGWSRSVLDAGSARGRHPRVRAGQQLRTGPSARCGLTRPRRNSPKPAAMVDDTTVAPGPSPPHGHDPGRPRPRLRSPAPRPHPRRRHPADHLRRLPPRSRRPRPEPRPERRHLTNRSGNPAINRWIPTGSLVLGGRPAVNTRPDGTGAYRLLPGPALGCRDMAATPAPNLVNLEAVSKGFGTRTLLDEVSLGVGRGERIGVVGRNGDGKSTLLRLLAGREEADRGRITQNRDLRLGYLGQSDDLDPDRDRRARGARWCRDLYLGGRSSRPRRDGTPARRRRSRGAWSAP